MAAPKRGLARPAEDLARQLLGRVSFGDPMGSDGPNGTIVNMEGSWVTVAITNPAVAFTAAHNLGLPVDGALTRPNVRWLLCGFEHSGAGAAAGDGLSVSYQYGDAMTTDAIDLRPHVAGARTVNAGNPLTVTLWFHPASQLT